MNILILGANGYIAREVITQLHHQHHIVACIRSDDTLLTALGVTEFIHADFLNDTDAKTWLPRLDNIDIVINCVGVFQAAYRTMWQIHVDTPKALYDACQQANVKKIIHISALGIDKIDVPYATSKLAIETYLQQAEIDHTIIRPSFVYGEGAYGGSALFRGLASMPVILPLPGRADHLLQPIHVKDLAQIVCESISTPGKHLLCAVGKEKIDLKSLLIKLRGWLGFKKALNIRMPIIGLKIAGFFGNYIYNSPLSATGVKMMQLDNVATDEQQQTLYDNISFEPRGFSEGLESMVSSVENRWHARLYFLRPLLRLCIAFIWIFSGVISFVSAQSQGFLLLQATGIDPGWQATLLYGGASIDILLGLTTLFNYRLRMTGLWQTIFILTYTIIASVYFPTIWLSPLTPIAKNIPLLAATWIMMALEKSR